MSAVASARAAITITLYPAAGALDGLSEKAARQPRNSQVWPRPGRRFGPACLRLRLVAVSSSAKAGRCPGEHKERHQGWQGGVIPGGQADGQGAATAVITPPVTAARGVAARARQTREQQTDAQRFGTHARRRCGVAWSRVAMRTMAPRRPAPATIATGFAVLERALLILGPAYRLIRAPVYNHLSNRKMKRSEVFTGA